MNKLYRFRLLWIFILSALFIHYGSAQSEKKIALFGSSVCNGTGDHQDQGGYAGRFKELMKKYGWEVVSVSRGGDNTITIQNRWQKSDIPPKKPVNNDQYLLPQKPGTVIIGLSLANEGIRKETKREQDSVFEQFRSGMLGIIKRCRDEGYRVVIANCYPHLFYTPEQYEAIQEMNRIINSWDLPSINLLGSIDDGNGHWVEGFYRDEGHPSGGGHREMFFTIAPTLFDALQMKKPLPAFANSTSYASVDRNKDGSFIFTPEDTIHSFTVSFMFRGVGDLTAVKIFGSNAEVITTQFVYKDTTRTGLVIGAGKEKAAMSLHIRDRKLVYQSVSGKEFITTADLQRNRWHRITLSHRLAKGETLLFIDSVCVGTFEERIVPQQFLLGINGHGDFKDVLIYRSSLNAGEIKALIQRRFIQSSLEIYSPLNDTEFVPGRPVYNLAQSLSNPIVQGKIEPGKKIRWQGE